ncbi:hypothetical protein ACFX13_024345 [Malus domestica]
MYCGLLAQLNAMVKSRLLPLYLPHAALFRQAVRISPESDVLTNETLPVVHQTSRAHEQVSCPTVWQSSGVKVVYLLTRRKGEEYTYGGKALKEGMGAEGIPHPVPYGDESNPRALTFLGSRSLYIAIIGSFFEVAAIESAGLESAARE